MLISPIPAPGFRLITGNRNPPASAKGYWVQCRNGWVDRLAPWPAEGPRWKWSNRPDDWDVIAVKRAA